VELRTPTNESKENSKKYRGNLISKEDVGHDELLVICNKNLKRPRNFGDIGKFGEIGRAI
jgi:hypothetical protein